MNSTDDIAGGDDRSGDPEYTQLGDDGNPFSNKSAGQEDAPAIDQVPADPASGSDDADQNAPLPDWGPTDGTHGVDGADPSE